jgi:uncharacterized membrane protein YesL
MWMALVGLYDETLTLVAANLGGVALNLPIGIGMILIGVLLPAFQDDVSRQWLVGVVFWLLLLVPTPGNVALGAVARVAAGPDVPRLSLFRDALRGYWRQALGYTAVTLLVTLALVWNVWFYYNVGTGWLQLISILWLYATLFWLSLHIYVVPLLLHVAEPHMLDVYRRAALVALGHAGYTFVLLVAVLLIGLLSVVFLPVYVLVTDAYIGLVQAHAFREIRRRHGDLVAEQEEEVSRL